ncbi:MAG: amidohydrolase family protein, partial [Pseudomonadota bacterium]
DKQEPAPPRDLRLETLSRALKGEEEIRAHLHTPNQIRGAISLVKEFGLDLQLHHATFAYKVIDDIAAAKLPVVGVPLFTKFGFRDDVLEAPGKLADAGVTFAFHTDDPAASAKWFRHTGGLAIRYGMDKDAALKGLTSDAAILAHVADRTGSLAPGKDADFVVLDGPWFEMTTMTEQVYVDGVLAFDATCDIEPVAPAPPPKPGHWVNPLDSAALPIARDNRPASPLIAIRSATIHTNSAAPIKDGVVLMQNGKIRAVGARAEVTIPQGAQIIDATGRHVIPGLVDAATHYGVSGDNLSETASPINPQRRAIDAFAPRMLDTEPDTGPMRATELLSGGVTTQYIRLGGATVIDGQGVIVKTAAPDLESAILREPAGMSINVSSRPTRTFREKEQSPATLSAVIAALRDALVKAGEFAAKSDGDDAPAPRDLGNEALAAMRAGKMPARVEATAPSHLRSALRVAEEFDLPLIIEGGTAAFTIRSELAAKKVPVILGLTSAPYPTGGEVPDEADFPIIAKGTPASARSAALRSSMMGKS